MFDPSKVVRYKQGDRLPVKMGDNEFVFAGDFDGLYELYEKLKVAANFALDSCCDLIETEEGYALKNALGREEW